MPEVQGMDNASAEVDNWITRKATAEEKFYLDSHLESLKQSTPYLNDVLQRVMTLATALVGVAIISSRESLMPSLMLALTLMGLLSSLAFALYGLYPRSTFYSRHADEIAEFESRVNLHKKRQLELAAGSLFVALVIASFGITIRAMRPSSPTPIQVIVVEGKGKS